MAKVGTTSSQVPFSKDGSYYALIYQIEAEIKRIRMAQPLESFQ